MKYIYVCLQEPEAVISVFRVSFYNLTPAGNQQADVLAQVWALATDPLVDTADNTAQKECPPQGPSKIVYCQGCQIALKIQLLG